MWTGEKAKRSTYSSEWQYFIEGAAHMIYINNHDEPENFLQDKVLVAEKHGQGMYAEDNKEINANFDKAYNNVVFQVPEFNAFLTKQKLIDVKDGESVGEFMEALMKNASPIRPEHRNVAWLVPESRYWIEKNLFYISPVLREGYAKSEALVFFAEIKPKCCFDEVPNFEEISSYITASSHGEGVDHQHFYDKFFKNCPPSERKFVYRKIVGNHKDSVLSEFNTADFYSKEAYVRSKAIKGLIKTDWGNYLKILDKDRNIIAWKDIIPFFRQWDDQITVKSISEIIARSINKNLIAQVTVLQKFFQFYADRLKNVQKTLEEKKSSIKYEQIEAVMKKLCAYFVQGEIPPLEKIEAEMGDDAPLVEIVAFLISLTSRDSSFLLRTAVSRKDHNFSVIEEWEKETAAEMSDIINIAFYNATPIQQGGEISAEKHTNILADMIQQKFDKGYSHQKMKEGVKDESRTYYIKSRTNLVDVGLKPWNKVHSFVESNHKVNSKFVEFLLQNKYHNQEIPK